MIQLGNFILISLSIILYLIWSYFSIKALIKYGIISCSYSASTYAYVLINITLLILLILFVVGYYGLKLVKYLNKYTIL